MQLVPARQVRVPLRLGQRRLERVALRLGRRQLLARLGNVESKRFILANYRVGNRSLLRRFRLRGSLVQLRSYRLLHDGGLRRIVPVERVVQALEELLLPRLFEFLILRVSLSEFLSLGLVLGRVLLRPRRPKSLAVRARSRLGALPLQLVQLGLVGGLQSHFLLRRAGRLGQRDQLRLQRRRSPFRALGLRQRRRRRRLGPRQRRGFLAELARVRLAESFARVLQRPPRLRRRAQLVRVALPRFEVRRRRRRQGRLELRGSFRSVLHVPLQAIAFRLDLGDLCSRRLLQQLHHLHGRLVRSLLRRVAQELPRNVGVKGFASRHGCDRRLGALPVHRLQPDEPIQVRRLRVALALCRLDVGARDGKVRLRRDGAAVRLRRLFRKYGAGAVRLVKARRRRRLGRRLCGDGARSVGLCLLQVLENSIARIFACLFASPFSNRFVARRPQLVARRPQFQFHGGELSGEVRRLCGALEARPVLFERLKRGPGLLQLCELPFQRRILERAIQRRLRRPFLLRRRLAARLARNGVRLEADAIIRTVALRRGAGRPGRWARQARHQEPLARGVPRAARVRRRVAARKVLEVRVSAVAHEAAADV
mmetsp:Transcript_23208/g.78380  ORF Transcript_23208/g.78380 Transcript_23208/m.78380 type:complete len:597 (-) Transcript_23208:923-2713(-)